MADDESVKKEDWCAEALRTYSDAHCPVHGFVHWDALGTHRNCAPQVEVPEN